MYSSNHLSGKVHHHHTQSNSMQDNFQQTQTCQIGLPIDEVKMNNNPSQNIVQNNNPNQLNPSHPNPQIIYYISINPSHPNPEIVYCTMWNNSRAASENWIGRTQALRQIHSELNLAMSNLNLIDMESKVISQIIQNNSNVSSEKIRQGKQKIRKYGSILLGLLGLITTLLIAGYSIDMKNNAYGNIIVIPYIVHMILWGVLLLCALYGILRCSYRVIYFGLVFAYVFNTIYGLVVMLVTLIYTEEQNNPKNSYQEQKNGGQEYFDRRLGIQLAAFFVGVLVPIFFNLVRISMNRFLNIVQEL